VASASFYNKNRFQRLLNRYQNQNRFGLGGQQYYGQQNWYDQDQDLDQNQNLYGFDDVDDYAQDYAQQIRRQCMIDQDQCPRDIESILGQECQDEECDFDDLQGQYGRRQLTDLDDIQGGMEGMRGRRNQWTSDLDDIEGDLEGFQGGLEGLRGGLEDIQGFQDEQYETGSTHTLLKEVQDANCKLATRLYKQCKDEKDDKNTVVSPLSVQVALAALNYGARGNTKRQIGRVIAGNLKKHERRQIFRKLVQHLKGFRQIEYSTQQQKTQIKPVTAIIVGQMNPGQQQFLQILRNTMHTTVKHCNFHRQPQQCRQQINRLIAQKTQGKLTRIVPQDAITDNTKMIVVNGMHVKATWGPQMRRHVTKEAKFYPLDSKKVKIVEVLETQGRFKYHEDELCKIVGVPTQQKELTLYVIVPKDKDGLTEVEKLHLQDSVQLKQLLEKTDRHVRHVGVQLPKFQIKHKVDVRRTLQKQGVTDAFDPLRADFSGITGMSKLHQDEIEDTYRTQYDNDVFGLGQMGGRFRRNQMWGQEDELMGGQWQTGMQQDTKLHLNKFIHQSTIKITENGITAASGSGNQYEQYEDIDQLRQTRYGRMGGLNMFDDEMNVFDEITGFNLRQTGDRKFVKANRAFAFVLKHNPTKQLVFVGRVIDAAQKKVNNVPQTINVVDQA